MTAYQDIVYSNRKFQENIHENVIDHHQQIESWFRNQWLKYPAPFYSSVDIRNSGFKISPVDTNLFPAGFNNLNKDFESLYVTAVKHSLDSLKTKIEKILIIPESHTRNIHYLESLNYLSLLIKKSGYDVKVSKPGIDENKFKNTNSILEYDGFIPDAILLNNDLSSGIPDFLNNIKQIVLPSKNIGWTRRSKSDHFKYYSDVCTNFSKLLKIDPWLIEPEFRNCGEINFKTKQGEDCLIYHAEKLFSIITEKYKMYDIEEKPYIIIKADAGTYGMGVISVNSIDQIKNLNRKQRNKMSSTKGTVKPDSVILQEGVFSFEEIKNTNSVAEPVIYSFSNFLIGGFYRAHDNKANNENLNSPGMIFHPIPLNDICISPDISLPVDSQINKYYVYGVIARLAILAAAKEIFNLD
jgi:glutamate--cysteine ligase